VIRTRIAALLPLAFALASCAVNPATGRKEFSLVSADKELQIGREGHTAIVAEYGLYGDSTLAAYVDSVGQALARVSHMPELKWTFTLLDDPVVNAFALPGGYIYITRGILAHLNSEAQLAGVLGHEIGHVTARHSAQRLTQQQLAGAGLLLASALSKEFARYGEAAQTALGLMMLKYGRDDETQSDELGVGYSAKAGYDPREIPATYHMLKRVGESAGQRLPAFLSTHPDPGDRENRTRALATTASEGKTGLKTGGRTYLQRLDRVIFGHDPRQGYFEGERYYHPQLAFTLAFPAGWKYQDSRSSVVSASQDGKAIMELRLADAGTLTPAAYANDLVRRGRVLSANGAAESFGGLDAWLGRLATTGQSGAAFTFVGAFVRRAPQQMFQLLGNTAAPGDADEGRIVASMRSFRPLTDAARLNVGPDRLKVVKVASNGTFESVIGGFGKQAADLAATSILNNVEPAEEVRAGQLLKIVEPGRPR
jgi:predicted Zn-dependent protease